jgi:DNA polymerase III epsilon subunit-like protein
MSNLIFAFDTETTGFIRKNVPHNDPKQARCCQLAGLLIDPKDWTNWEVVDQVVSIIKPDGWTIPPVVAEIHGITQEIAEREGKPVAEVLTKVQDFHDLAALVLAHNFDYDNGIMEIESFCTPSFTWRPIAHCCTMREATAYCGCTKANGSPKWPKLIELCNKLFGPEEAAKFEAEAHDALADIKMTAKCYFELVRLGVIAKPF